MKTFSKFLALFLCFIMIVSFAACDGSGNTDVVADTAESGNSESANDNENNVQGEDVANVEEANGESADDNTNEDDIIDEETFLAAVNIRSYSEDQLKELEKIHLKVEMRSTKLNDPYLIEFSKDGDKLYFKYDENEIYFKLSEKNNVWLNGKWQVPDAETQELIDSYIKAFDFSSANNMFAEFSFDSFTYDPETGTFVANKVINMAGVGEVSDLVVLFKNKKISNIHGKVTYDDKPVEIDYTFEYDEFGRIIKNNLYMPTDFSGIKVDSKTIIEYTYNEKNLISKMTNTLIMETDDPLYSAYLNYTIQYNYDVEYGIEIVMPE